MEFRQKFHVFQIVSYQLSYIYNGPQNHRGVSLDHLEQFRISFKTFEKKSAEFRLKFRVFQKIM